MKRLERPGYLHWLIQWKDQQIIKVVTGVRRCGKSTLFAMYQDHLRAQGIAPEQIISKIMSHRSGSHGGGHRGGGNGGSGAGLLYGDAVNLAIHGDIVVHSCFSPFLNNMASHPDPVPDPDAFCPGPPLELNPSSGGPHLVYCSIYARYLSRS